MGWDLLENSSWKGVDLRLSPAAYTCAGYALDESCILALQLAALGNS
jgi:hypothetical protein